MPDLIAKSPLAGQAPLALAGVTLSEGHPGPITSIAPYPGNAAALAKALKPLGLTFPAPNRFTESDTARLVWTGRDQAFLIGAPAPHSLAPHAALTDQSDGWAALRLTGDAVEPALARLVPIDIRAAAFPCGHAARTPLNHLSAILIRVAPQTVEILVFRSMARTAWHDIGAALSALAARP